MIEERDGALHEAFRALRRAAEAAAPDFRDTLAGLARRRATVARARRRFGMLAVAAAAVVLAVLGVTRFGGLGSRAAIVDLASTRWEAPTDFLLRTPGAELLRAVPTFTTDVRSLQ